MSVFIFTLKSFQNCYFHLQDLFGLLGRLHFQSHIDLVRLVHDFIDLTKSTPTNLLQLDRKEKLEMNDKEILERTKQKFFYE